ncbi:MAG: cation:proton antiporter [Nanoarchaeota archaeon]
MVAGVEIGLIFGFSLLGGLLATRFRQPTAIGLLLIGAIVGPNALSYISDGELIHLAIEIGAILLLFAIGIEFNIQKLLNLGGKALMMAIFKLGLVVFAGYYLALLLGFDVISSLALGVALAISSTVIMIRILKAKGLVDRNEVQLLIAVLIIEDIFGVFALTYFSSVQGTPGDLLSPLLAAFLVLIITYVVLKRVLRWAINWILAYSSEETSMFLGLGLLVGMSYLATVLGISSSVGAFLAGTLIASLPAAKSIEHAIHPFVLTFSSLFFFSLGTLVDFNTVITMWPIILAFFVFTVIAKSFAISTGGYLFGGLSGKQAAFAGLAMVPIGEFSLLVVAIADPLNPGFDLVSMVAAVIFLSTLITPLAVTRYEAFGNFCMGCMPDWMLKPIRLGSRYMCVIHDNLEYSRKQTLTLKNDLRRFFRGVGGFLALIALAGYIWLWLSPEQQLFLRQPKTLLTLAMLILVILAFIGFDIVRAFRNFIAHFRSFIRIFLPYDLDQEKGILKTFGQAILLYVFAVMLPNFVLLSNLDPAFNYLELLFLGLMAIQLFRGFSMIRGIPRKHLLALQKRVKGKKKLGR